MGNRVVGSVGVENVAAPIRSLTGLDHVDYVDVFTLSTPAAADWSPQRWARAVLEEAPAVRRFGFVPWRMLLGLRLGPSRTPGYVHGWKIADGDERWLRLEAASWMMTCNAVVRIEDDRISVALFVRYDNVLTALWWRAVSPVHRRAMPVILRQGLQVLTSTSAAPSRPQARATA
jgi:hypothetical protein